MLLVNCCTLSLELLNYHSVREKNGFRKCPRNDDLLVSQPRVPLCQAFSHSIGGQHESFG
jgi:hypothetical protein